MANGLMKAAALAVGLLAVLPAASAQAAPAAAWRTPDPENELVIDTTKGRVVVELSPVAAPQSVARIKSLARAHFYDGLIFHRVIDGFMAQTGDPKGTGEGGSDQPDVPGEFTFRRTADMPFQAVSRPAGAEQGLLQALPVMTQPDELMGMTSDGKVAAWGLFCPGVAGMARNDGPDTANSQFFLMRGAYPSLEKRYTAFGRVIFGQDAVKAMNVGEPPASPDKMLKVQIAADMRPADRPDVKVMEPTSPAFAALVEKARKDEGADFSMCDLPLPTQGGGGK